MDREGDQGESRTRRNEERCARASGVGAGLVVSPSTEGRYARNVRKIERSVEESRAVEDVARRRRYETRQLSRRERRAGGRSVRLAVTARDARALVSDGIFKG